MLHYTSLLCIQNNVHPYSRGDDAVYCKVRYTIRLQCLEERRQDITLTGDCRTQHTQLTQQTGIWNH